MRPNPNALTLADVKWLKPHEQSLPHVVDRLAAEISALRRLIHPVVADANTGLVVDGTHRVEAAAKLKIKRIPVYAVDYLSQVVTLRGWGRAASRNISADNVVETCKSLGFKMLDESSEFFDVCFFWSNGSSKKAAFGKDDLTKVYDRIFILETRLQKLEISYVRESDLEKIVFSREYPFGYLIRPLTKKEVLDTVMRGYRLPPKSTRHIIEGRPMFIYCPIEILNSEDADEKFAQHLSEGLWFEMPPGAELDRKYDEKTYVFYRDDLAGLYPEKILKMVKASQGEVLR